MNFEPWIIDVWFYVHAMTSILHTFIQICNVYWTFYSAGIFSYKRKVHLNCWNSQFIEMYYAMTLLGSLHFYFSKRYIIIKSWYIYYKITFLRRKKCYIWEHWQVCNMCCLLESLIKSSRIFVSFKTTVIIKHYRLSDKIKTRSSSTKIAWESAMFG